MNQYLEALNAYLAENPDAYGHPELGSMLDVLYYRFCIQEDLCSQKIRECFSEVEDILRPLSLQDNDRLSDLICALCESYEHEAFREGLVTGFRLFAELNAKDGK